MSDQHLPAGRPPHSETAGGSPAGDVAASVRLLPALPAPDPDNERDVRRLTVDWLLSLRSDRTRRAYFTDLGSWLSHCAHHAVNPLTALRADLDRWLATMTVQTPRGGTRAPAPSTIARRLASISSWYTYLESNQAATRNPAAHVKRPPTTEIRASARRAPTLSLEQTARLLATAEHHAERVDSEAAWRDAALLSLMFHTVLRVGAITHADLNDLDTEAGYRILRHGLKGHGERGRAFVRIDGEAGRLIDRYLQTRARRHPDEQTPPGPLFATAPHPRDPQGRPGGKRLTQRDVTNILQATAARAGLAVASSLSPHSSRRTGITTLLSADVSLPRVQDLAGHADPRTTRLYDETNNHLERSAVTELQRLLNHARRRIHHGEQTETPTSETPAP